MTAKKKNTTTLPELWGKYGRGAEIVLSDYLHAGEKGTYHLLANLPSREIYQRMESAVFSLPLAEQVQTAIDELITLYLEMHDWFVSMPKTFQEDAHGKLVAEARDALEEVIANVNVPIDIKLSVMYIPKRIGMGKAHRAKRRDCAVARMQACITAIKEIDEGEELIMTLTKRIKLAKGVKFPSRFT